MSNHAHNSGDTHGHADDSMDALVHSMPVVLPLVGAALIFLLAFIAVTVA